MCGIFAIFSLGSSEAQQHDEHELNRLISTMKHRGPDELWQTTLGNITLGFVRLSFLKKSTSIQEINSDNQDILILINGEIWNIDEVTKTTAYEEPHARSEYEVIRHAYHQLGTRFVELLDGMFVILLLDKRINKLYIYRDPVGIKPIFYSERNGKTAFSSDEKTLYQWSGYSPELNKNCLSNHYIFGFSDYTDNLFCGIRQVHPSSFLELDTLTGNISHHFYKSAIDHEVRSLIQPGRDWHDLQLGLLESSLQKCYSHGDDSRDKIGLLLSGGIDSSLLALLAFEMGLDDIVLFYMGDEDNEDFYWSHYVSKLTGFPFYHIRLPELEDVKRDIESTCHTLSGRLALSMFYLCKYAKDVLPDLRVLICGEGSDELYAGYPWNHNPRNRFVQMMANKFALETDNPEFQTDLMKAILIGKDGKAICFDNISDDELANLSLELDITYQLNDQHLVIADYASMAFSIEMRLPFLNIDNFVFARNYLPMNFKMRNGEKKFILKSIIQKKGYIEDDRFYKRRKLGLPSAFRRVHQELRCLDSRQPFWNQVVRQTFKC